MPSVISFLCLKDVVTLKEEFYHPPELEFQLVQMSLELLRAVQQILSSSVRGCTENLHYVV